MTKARLWQRCMYDGSAMHTALLMPMDIVSAATVQTAPSKLLTQLSHSEPKPSLKRKPTEAFT